MLKEIVTKAVISKGKISESNDLQIDVGKEANRVIGCWVINHNYLSLVENNKVYVSGAYDVHVWYAIDDSSDTRLLKKTIDYKQEIVMDNNNFNKEESEYKVYCIEYPNCTNLKLENNRILLTIKKGLALDVIGESKLLVQVSENTIRDEDLGINPNYIK